MKQDDCVMQVHLLTRGVFAPGTLPGKATGATAGAALLGMLRVAASETPTTAFSALDISPFGSSMRPVRHGDNAYSSLHGRMSHAGLSHCSRLVSAPDTCALQPAQVCPPYMPV